MLDKAEEIIKKYPLCDSCLGRLFGLKGYGLENSERGFAIKTLLLMKHYRADEGIRDRDLIVKIAETGFKAAVQLAVENGLSFERKPCYLCEGLLNRVVSLKDKILTVLKGYQFSTFLIGCKIPTKILKKEEALWSAYSLEDAESIKNEVSRRLGKTLTEALGKDYSPRSPDITVIVDIENEKIEIFPSPVFVYGRYRKLVRGLPQNPWLREDRSRIKYYTSIEELITKPMVRFFKGKGAKLHAAGREDVDVRTLGKGRPFVVEIKAPKLRQANLFELEKTINEEAKGLVEVHGLKIVDSKYVRAIKALAEIARKTYSARVVFESEINEHSLDRLEKEFRDVTISQRTPLRVLHRRKDRVRKKVVYEVSVRKLGDKVAEFKIVCQGGLYVKELIHGDNGRTKPNFAEILGNKVKSIELDVIDIEERLPLS